MSSAIDPALARKILAISVAPVVIAAGIILYGFPGRTAELFAWPIAPSLTPLLMGSGYLAAAWLFWCLWRTPRWSSVAPVLSGVLVFTVVMLTATLLHWERFSHGKFTFWLWLVVYVISPLAVAGVILLHRGSTEAPGPGGRIPGWLQMLFGLIFCALLLLALAMVFQPAWVIGVWPWKLTPLTSRVLGGWVAVLAVGGLHMVRHPHWDRWHVALETGALLFLLIGLAIFRAPGDFASPLGMQLFSAVIGGLLILFVGTWGAFRRA